MADTSDESRTTTPMNRPTRVRTDIQGLRALAVLLVIADHLFHVPSGGYIGVDVFFVISGFLITGQLLRDVERFGRIRFRRFWLHRVRRILPAAVLTVAATVIASALAFGPTRFRSVVADAFWSVLSVGNWHFAAIGTNYSQADGPVSPLQHFWSLGVEEQFYVVWPVLIAVVLILFRRRFSTAIVVALAVVMAGSFVFAVAQTVATPTVAYFSTVTRAWELALGAGIAIGAPRLQALPPLARTIGAWAGLALIAVAAIVFTAATPFPGPWAALPVIGAGLIIASGTGGDAAGLWPLTNRVAGWVGDRSYSLYLWHYPAVVVLAALLPAGSWRYLAAVLLVTAVCTVLSYRFVEEPIRRWRAPDGSRSGRRLRRRATTSAAAVLAAVIVAGVSVAAVRPEAPVTVPTMAASSDASADLSAQLSAAVTATTWPKQLTPTIDAAADDASPAMTDTACFNPTDLTNDDACTTGSGTKTAMVTGDSIAMAWEPAVRSALGDGWRVHAMGFSNCPLIAADITYAASPSQSDTCNTNRQARIAQIERIHPDLLVVSDLELGITRLADDASGQQAIQEWTAGREQIIRTLRSHVGRIVVLSSNPVGPSLSCADAGAPPRACASSVSGAWKAKAAADKAASNATGATYIDGSRWFCTADGICPAFVNGILVRWDAGHMTQTYARYIAPLLRPELLP